jgi:hypothetical protein
LANVLTSKHHIFIVSFYILEGSTKNPPRFSGEDSKVLQRRLQGSPEKHALFSGEAWTVLKTCLQRYFYNNGRYCFGIWDVLKIS